MEQLNITNMSFMLTFLGLTGTIVFTAFGSFDKFNEKEKHLRSALITETAVNIIAGITYAYMMKFIQSKNITDYTDITSLRYLDWVITTPFLILSFVFFSNYVENKNNKGKLKKPNFKPLSWIIPLNIVMLGFGFLGERGLISKQETMIGGFGAFIGMFISIYNSYVKDKPKEMTDIYYPFLVIWLLYGIVFLLPSKEKNICYNLLDLVSKTGFGIFLWAKNIDREDTTCNTNCIKKVDVVN